MAPDWLHRCSTAVSNGNKHACAGQLSGGACKTARWSEVRTGCFAAAAQVVLALNVCAGICLLDCALPLKGKEKKVLYLGSHFSGLRADY